MPRLQSIPGAAVTGPVLWAAARARVAFWDRLASSPTLLEEKQTEILLHNCKSAADTQFGRQHGLGQVRSHRDFANRVPLRTYADLEPFINRMKAGARDVLWPGFIRYFGCSSGSSNTAALNKYLPISDEQIRWQQKAGFDLTARYVAMTGDRALTGGYTMYLLPPAQLKPEGPIFVTSNPGLMQLHLPAPAAMLALPKPAIRDIEVYDEKLGRMAEAYLDYDVRSMSGTTCWFSIFFDRVLAAAKARGRPASKISDIWPNLRVLFGGGVPAEPYRSIIAERVGHPVVLMDNYNATEGGIFAATDQLGSDSLLMIPDRGVFYEFVPREDHGKPSARRLPLWEVEPGVEYSVALCTSSGLFGYYIGDTIRFTSVFPHRIEFTGRTAGVLSVTQELTSSIEIERAVLAATKRHPCTIVDFAATSEVGVDASAKGRYLLFVEFDREPQDLQSFASAFDVGLCEQNRVYREHRKQDVAILPPAVLPLGNGATRRFMDAMGQSTVQHKFPRIVEGRRRELLASLARPASN
ncbi:MAG TPA: GH3 auxin-responsive promoter family protein [Myxococcales bacterium]|nr:GH3 auxin-responsive promoter family protein [Myxococcales bacterium]